MIDVSWLKKLIALHELLAAQTNQLLRSGTHPEWLPQGLAVLIMNYTIQLLAYNLLQHHMEAPISIMMAKMSGHMNPYMSRTQKGIRNNQASPGSTARTAGCHWD